MRQFLGRQKSHCGLDVYVKQYLNLIMVVVGMMLGSGWLAVPAAGAQQEDPPASLKPEFAVSYTFGQAMVFALEVTNEPELTLGTLFVSTPQFNTTYKADFTVEAAAQDRVRLEHQLDLQKVNIQPFTTVTYWWVVESAAGDLYQLEPQFLSYDDDRFDWKERKQAGIEVYWIADGTDLGQVALDVVLEAVPRIQSVVQADLPQPLRIYLYPSAADMRSALLLNGQPWVGGHASPELGVIMLPAENPRTAVVDLRRRLPHEMSHLLLYEATGVGHENVPRWFDEGLATLFEAVPNPNYEPALQEALEQDNLIPFETMCERFPDSSTSQIYLAYAQSSSLVAFMRAKYGNEVLRGMIAAYADGADCETAVSRSLGVSLDEVITDWQADLRPSNSARLLSQNLIWIVVLFGGFGLTLLLALVPGRR